MCMKVMKFHEDRESDGFCGPGHHRDDRLPSVEMRHAKAQTNETAYCENNEIVKSCESFAFEAFHRSASFQLEPVGI